MKIRLEEIKCPVDYTQDIFYNAVRDAFNRADAGIDTIFTNENIRIIKKSLDARKKPHLYYVFTVDVYVGEPVPDKLENSLLRVSENIKPPSVRPVVAGCGPSGLFAALVLAIKGYRPILIERGKTIEARKKDVRDFWTKGKMSPESNVQFGEGGAGTFSDGKLTTGIRDDICRSILETFADAGAPEEILYEAKPHIGTDLLCDIIRRIRERIEFLGGTVMFETRLSGFRCSDGKLSGVEIESKPNPEINFIETDTLILAIGHSARDTFRMLYEKGVDMQQKPFSMGLRIEHKQKDINICQYGRQDAESEKILPAADYKLSYHLPNGRSAYTFCMCPGGRVIASASGEGQVVTNGMSLFARDGENANSAILVNIETSDFGGDSPLAGIEFQEKWEHQAFLAGRATYRAPAQYAGDFLKAGNAPDIKNIVKSGNVIKVAPTYLPGIVFTNLEKCLPRFVVESIREAIPVFNRKMPGFASPGALLTGIESRSSSPVRILRDSARMANISGIYPCGEGAGYAGGIMSSAVDGVKCAYSCIEGEPVKN
ncbi:MAG: NAD(P)/FAD-dependent oxidoreductase [Saccharofermentanales bacterium]